MAVGQQMLRQAVRRNYLYSSACLRLDFRTGLVDGTTAPSAFEDLVQQKHGHIATDAIALSRNTGDSFDHCLPKSGLKRIELQHIRQAGK